LFYNYGKKSGFYSGILLDFEEAEYNQLNPAELKRKITRWQNKLMELCNEKRKHENFKHFVYNLNEAMNYHFV